MWLMLSCHRMRCVSVVNTNLNSSCDLFLNKIRTSYIYRYIYKYITGFILYNCERVESASPSFSDLKSIVLHLSLNISLWTGFALSNWECVENAHRIRTQPMAPYRAHARPATQDWARARRRVFIARQAHSKIRQDLLHAWTEQPTRSHKQLAQRLQQHACRAETALAAATALVVVQALVVV